MIETERVCVCVCVCVCGWDGKYGSSSHFSLAFVAHYVSNTKTTRTYPTLCRYIIGEEKEGGRVTTVEVTRGKREMAFCEGRKAAHTHTPQ